VAMLLAVQACHLHYSGIAHVRLESQKGHGCPMLGRGSGDFMYYSLLVI
jgi:hypothetical protein